MKLNINSYSFCNSLKTTIQILLNVICSVSCHGKSDNKKYLEIQVFLGNEMWIK